MGDLVGTESWKRQPGIIRGSDILEAHYFKSVYVILCFKYLKRGFLWQRSIFRQEIRG